MKKLNNIRAIAYKFLLLLAFGFVFTGCKDKFEPEESFIKVYEDKDGNRNYVPLSMKQTNDNGYLILSAYNGWNIHLVKTDDQGELLWEFDVPTNYVNAVPNLIEKNGSMYFVCMDAVGLFTYIMNVDQNAQSVTEYQSFQEIKYPLYATATDNAVFIENYERITYRTGIYELNNAMDQIEKSGSVQIFTSVEDKIFDHINHTGKRFPFSICVTPEKDYIVLNGFNNYSFSTVFLDNDLDLTGAYNGAAFDGGLNAFLPLGGNQFSLARFSFSNLFYNPSASLTPTANDIAEAIPAEGKPELEAEKPILIKNISINGTEYIAYLASTKSNQLLLSLYGKGSSELLGSKYLGQNVPLQACDFANTNDGGLMVLTQITVMGSFNRIATIKISKTELEGFVE